MGYIKYGLLAAVLLVVTALVLSTPAKESFQAWRADVPVESSETICTQEYVPVCGQAPEYCFYADPPPSFCDVFAGNKRRTFSNGCELTRAHAAPLYQGICQNDSDGETFSASPTSGLAPLLVTYIVPTSYVNLGASIYFGDGSKSGLWPHCKITTESLDGPHCVALESIQHTYNLRGTYTAMLERPANNDFQIQGETYGKIIITVH